MILVDANLLVYAHVSDFAEHERARAWLDEQLNGSGRVGLPWVSLVAFLRLVTNPRVFPTPEPVERAWQQVEDWLERPAAWVPAPTARHRQVMGEILSGGAITGNLVPDAYVAALAQQHGLAVASTDGDFARFAGIRWVDPLRGASAR